MVYSAYHFYGAHVPRDWWFEPHPHREGDRLDAVIASYGLSDRNACLAHLTAGEYDQDMLFLTVQLKGLDTEVKLGEFRRSPTLPVTRQWDMALRAVAAVAGYDPRKLVCGWITVLDCS